MEEENLLVSLLKEGSVASFTDLFYLAHRGLAPGEPPEEPTVLRAIAASLAAGEAARRTGDNEKLIGSLHSTGAHYAAAGKPGCAVMFFTRALALSRGCANLSRELQCLRDLGLCEFARDNLHGACEHHEARRALALKSGSLAALAESCADLVAARTLQARSAEDKGEVHESLRFFELALEAARHAGNAEGEAELSYSVGRAYALAGNAAEAVAHLSSYVSCVVLLRLLLFLVCLIAQALCEVFPTRPPFSHKPPVLLAAAHRGGHAGPQRLPCSGLCVPLRGAQARGGSGCRGGVLGALDCLCGCGGRSGLRRGSRGSGKSGHHADEPRGGGAGHAAACGCVRVAAGDAPARGTGVHTRRCAAGAAAAGNGKGRGNAGSVC